MRFVFPRSKKNIPFTESKIVSKFANFFLYFFTLQKFPFRFAHNFILVVFSDAVECTEPNQYMRFTWRIKELISSFYQWQWQPIKMCQWDRRRSWAEHCLITLERCCYAVSKCFWSVTLRKLQMCDPFYDFTAFLCYFLNPTKKNWHFFRLAQ